MANAHIVSHTHWDREWYFSTMDSLVLSEQVFSDVLQELEANPNVNFCLDGQVSIIDSYLTLHPEALDTIKRLVAQKRLFIGPWYTQSDCLLPCDEAILRNLMIGIKESKKYGDFMAVGYLPDTFGFNAQMPTIVKQVGIDTIVFWRGIDFEKQVPSPYFKWKGLGDKEILGINIPHGYSTAAFINTSTAFVKERLDKTIDYLVERSGGEDIVIPAGGDQLNIVRGLDAIVDTINQKSKHNIVISSYPEFINIMKTKEHLPTYQGEFRDPVYARVHRTIASIRYSIKNENFKLEQKLLKRIEPLLVIARKNDIIISNELVLQTWKKVLESQAHDSIAGCVNDSVAQDILQRYKEANELCDGIENTILKKIQQAANISNNEILICNTFAHTFNGYTEFSLLVEDKNIVFDTIEEPVILEEREIPARKNVMVISPEQGHSFIDEPHYYQLKIRAKVEIPPLGYTTISYRKSDVPLPKMVKSSATTITNSKISISFMNGKVNYQQGDTTIEDILCLVDSGNDGDTYDYSPLEDENEMPLPFHEAYTLESAHSHILVLEGKALLPETLEERKKDIPRVKECTYQVLLTLEEHSTLVAAKIVFNNTIDSHRLRIKYNTEVENDSTMAQIQAGFIEHTNTDIPLQWQEKYVEKPVNIFNFNTSVSTHNSSTCFTVYTKGLMEYEKNGKDLLVTICSTTGELGKPNLQWRPGRASGDTTMKGHIMMPTPLAQEKGIWEVEFAFEITDQFDEFAVYTTGERWLQPSIVYQKQDYNYFMHRLDNRLQLQPHTSALKKTFSMGELPDTILLNAIYPSYYDDAYCILRLINPTKQEVQLPELLWNKEVVYIDALERTISTPSKIPPYDMVTLKIKYK